MMKNKRKTKRIGGDKMKLSQVKSRLNRLVYYDTGQIDLNGCSIKDFILTACILRKNKKEFIIMRQNLKSKTAEIRWLYRLKKF